MLKTYYRNQFDLRSPPLPMRKPCTKLLFSIKKNKQKTKQNKKTIHKYFAANFTTYLERTVGKILTVEVRHYKAIILKWYTLMQLWLSYSNISFVTCINYIERKSNVWKHEKWIYPVMLYRTWQTKTIKCPYQMTYTPCLPNSIVRISNEPRHDKTNNVAVRPAKTQISLGIRIRPVWSESSLPRLIWVFVRRTLTLLVLSCRSSNSIIVRVLLTCSETYRLFESTKPQWDYWQLSVNGKIFGKIASDIGIDFILLKII